MSITRPSEPPTCKREARSDNDRNVEEVAPEGEYHKSVGIKLGTIDRAMQHCLKRTMSCSGILLRD